MSKGLKKVIIILGILLISSIFFLIWLRRAVGKGYNQRDYQQRCVECDPNKIINTLENIFDANVPEDIEEVKAAESPSIDGAVIFILKFTAKPDVVDRFLHSFSEQKKLDRTPYKIGDDYRATSGTWPQPDWFVKPIKNGKQGSYFQAFGYINFYIDTTDESKYMIYLHGRTGK
jgi:hypothetical protein